MALTDQLIAHWTVDETSSTRNDSHGTNHATAVNSPGSAFGKMGNGVDLEVSSAQYLQVADNANISLSTDTDFTIAVWVQAESLANFNAIFSKAGNGNGTNDEYNLDYRGGSTNRFRLYVGNGTTFGSVDANNFGALTPGQWAFVVAWHDSAANKLYIQVNGGTPNEASWTGGTQNTTSALRIGGYPFVSTLQWDGIIDSVSFWKRVLTSDERAALFNGGDGLLYENFDDSGETIGELSGSASVAFSTSGALTGRGALAGTSSASFAASGTLTATGALQGASAFTFDADGHLTGSGLLSASAAASFSTTGNLTGAGALSGSSAGSFTASGALTARGALSGSLSVTVSAAGNLTGIGSLSGQSSFSFTCSGLLTGPALVIRFPVYASLTTSHTFTDVIDSRTRADLVPSHSYTELT